MSLQFVVGARVLREDEEVEFVEGSAVEQDVEFEERGVGVVLFSEVH